MNTNLIAAYESWRTEDKELLPIQFGEEFVLAGIGEGKYQVTPYKSWIIKSEKPNVVLLQHS